MAKLRFKTKFYPNSFTAGATIFEGKPIITRFKELTMTEKILGALGLGCVVTTTCCLCSKCGCLSAASYASNILCSSCCGTGESITCDSLMCCEGCLEPCIDNNIANCCSCCCSWNIWKLIWGMTVHMYYLYWKQVRLYCESIQKKEANYVQNQMYKIKM